MAKGWDENPIRVMEVPIPDEWINPNAPGGRLISQAFGDPEPDHIEFDMRNGQLVAIGYWGDGAFQR